MCDFTRINVIRSRPYQAGTQWEFTGALYFSMVVAVIGKLRVIF